MEVNVRGLIGCWSPSPSRISVNVLFPSDFFLVKMKSLFSTRERSHVEISVASVNCRSDMLRVNGVSAVLDRRSGDHRGSRQSSYPPKEWYKPREGRP